MSQLFSSIRRLLNKEDAKRTANSTADPQYFSAYGGLWIDRSDWGQGLDDRVKRGLITSDEARQIEQFAQNGYSIIPGAVEPEVIDRFSDEITKAWLHGDERLRILKPRESGGTPLSAGSDRTRARVVDTYVFYQSAIDLLLSDRLSRFLRLIFEDDPLLFQSLSFNVGSQQGMHQDTAYVVVSSPLELAASWIALEDIQEGSGELMYIPGSHRVPEFHFSGVAKHYSADRDGSEAHAEWQRLLFENCEKMGLKPQFFRPKKGDALVWAADLAHGGGPVNDRALTRRSLVGHYCPNRVDPHYFSFQPDHRTKVRAGNGLYSSSYYSIG
jgi:phytanoyl-CoA hydroxylase